VRTTEFTLTAQKRTQLYESGKKAAQEFLRTWNDAAYIRRARVPTSPKYKRARREYRERIAQRSARMIGSRAYREQPR
jgi:hypothetical protein